MHDSSVSGIPKRPVRRLRDRPIVEADAVLGHGPLFNAGVLHHTCAHHPFPRSVRDGYAPAPSRPPGGIRDRGAAS